MRKKVKVRLPVRNKTEVRTYKQTVVNAVILVVVIALFLYVAIQISQSFSTKVSTQRTQTVTDTVYTYLDGYIFKDSAQVKADGDVIHYLVGDGEKVGVGQAYAEVYTGSPLSPDERESAERRLGELTERISMLESGLESGKNVADLGAILSDIDTSYYAYIDAVLGGNLDAAGDFGDTLLGGLVDYSAVTLSEVARSTLSELKAERDSLISSIGGTKQTLISDKSFTFYRDTDGYEGILNFAAVAELSRDTLDSLASMSAERGDGAIGSAVYTSKWYIALPTTEAEYIAFKDSLGDTFNIGFIGSDGLTLPMVLEAAFAEENDVDRAYLLFSSFDLARISGLDRHQSIRIEMSSCTGYRIPSGATVRLGEQDGVYILVGNRIEFRRITLIGEGDGYYIANTYERDYEEDSKSEIPYLSINDLIVTSGRDLYDGKLLD